MIGLKNCRVVICVANYSWFGKRPWREPMIAVLLLTAILKEKTSLFLVDANGENLSIDDVKDRLEALSPDIVLIPALSIDYWKNYHEIARIAKFLKSNCVCIMGGVYPTVLPEKVIDDVNIDYAFIGYAETRLDKLIEFCFYDKRDKIKNFQGIAYRNEGNNVINPINTFIGDVAEMVKPDYSLMNLENYFSYQNMSVANFNNSSNKRNALIITSYGCPNNCLFCATRLISGRKTAFRKVDDVLDEIDYLVTNHCIDSITIEDDSILTDRKRAEAIFNGIIARDYSLEIRIANVAAWHLDEDIVQLMKRAGLVRLGISVESGCERVLHQIIRKPLNLDIIKPLVSMMRKNDVLMLANFVIGFPGETWDEIRETFKFADDCDFDLAMFHVATVYPKTDLYELARKQNLLPDNFSFYDEGRFGCGRGVITTKDFTPEELMILRAYEWDRINFSSEERKKRALRVMEVTEEELEEHRRQTRRKLGMHF